MPALVISPSSSAISTSKSVVSCPVAAIRSRTCWASGGARSGPGNTEPGDRLPSETALLERFRDQFGTLSLPTLRQAIGLLRSEGLVEAQQGIGTFIKTDRRLQRL